MRPPPTSQWLHHQNGFRLTAVPGSFIHLVEHGFALFVDRLSVKQPLIVEYLRPSGSALEVNVRVQKEKLTAPIPSIREDSSPRAHHAGD
ncbi:hypothetical protein AJ87_21225 [Rhizobium yanglingense]|nr:hypothetical protein AJ87_21225 [Rhizobium yanglingense]